MPENASARASTLSGPGEPSASGMALVIPQSTPSPAPLAGERSLHLAPSNGDLVVEQLVREHLPLVGYIVRETLARVPSHVDRDDLHSAGCSALFRAAQTWEADRGIPFSRYASRRIRGAMLDELRTVDWASRSVRRRGREIESARATLAATLRTAPDDAQVAASLGISLAEVEQSDEDVARASVLSLDAADEHGTASDSLAATEPSPDALVEHRERLQYLVEAVAELPERLRAVVQGYFLDERPMTEIAVELGITESRVSQIRAEALVLLRDALNSALEPELVAPAARPGGAAARRREAYFSAVADRHSARYVARRAAWQQPAAQLDSIA